jgi:hypothetical protein
MPYVAIDGDRAVATAYAQLCRANGDDFRVWRVTATRWELERTADGWRVAHRTNRLLDGDPAAQELLRRGVVEGGGVDGG